MLNESLILCIISSFLVYLIFGVMFVMLLINVILEVPELNFPEMFSIKSKNSDPERQHLANAVSTSPSYTQFQDDEPHEVVAETQVNTQTLPVAATNETLIVNENLNASTPTDEAKHPLQ